MYCRVCTETRKSNGMSKEAQYENIQNTMLTLHVGLLGHKMAQGLASHAGVFRGARFSPLPTNACSTENNIPFPCLANHIVLSNSGKLTLTKR